MKAFPIKREDFECYSLVNIKPMELLITFMDSISLPFEHDCTYNCVLDFLKLVDVFTTKAKK